MATKLRCQCEHTIYPRKGAFGTTKWQTCRKDCHFGRSASTRNRRIFCCASSPFSVLSAKSRKISSPTCTFRERPFWLSKKHRNMLCSLSFVFTDISAATAHFFFWNLSRSLIGLRMLDLFVSITYPSEIISSRMKCAFSRLNIMSSSHTFSKYLSMVSTKL